MVFALFFNLKSKKRFSAVIIIIIIIKVLRRTSVPGVVPCAGLHVMCQAVTRAGRVSCARRASWAARGEVDRLRDGEVDGVRAGRRGERWDGCESARYIFLNIIIIIIIV